MRFAWILPLTVLSLAVLGCTRNAATGRDQFLLASPQQVAAMGDAAAPELIVEYGGEIDVPQLRRYISGVGDALVAHTEPAYAHMTWSFTMLDSDMINAFALPGGHVFITRGLVERFDNEGQLAGVLGHEIGHVTAQHVDEQISQTMLVQGLLGWVGSATESELAVYGANLFANGYLLHFNREQESEADVQGLKYMTAAGYDPAAMLQVLEVLASASQGPRPPEFLATHPHPETRMKNVRALLEGVYRHTQGDPSYGTYPDRFRREALPYLGREATTAQVSAVFCFFCALGR